MPSIQQHFGHFLPSVRTLALKAPRGSRRQIIYFIGSFKHLEDLRIVYDQSFDHREDPADDRTPTPPFAPPLRGSLTLARLKRVDILKDMIDLFGGIRFRYMDLCDVNGMRFLLEACAETLETLRLYPNEPPGKDFL